MKKKYLILVAVLSFNFQLFTLNCSAQWQQVMTGFPANTKPRGLTSFENVVFCSPINNSETYYIGLYWSFDNGLSWSCRNSNIGIGGSAYKNRLYTLTGINYDTLVVSSDSGLTYTNCIINNKKSNEQRQFLFQKILFQNKAEFSHEIGDTVIFDGNGCYYRSNDQGWSWYKYPIAADAGAMVFNNQSSFFFITNIVMGDSYIKKLDYQGQLQTIYTSPWIYPYDAYVSNIKDAMWVDSLLFICAPNKLKVLHTNGSIQNIFNGGVYSIAQYGDTIFIACGTDVLKASKNDYTNWVTMSDGLSGTYGVSTLYLYKNYLFAITNTDGILYRRELTPVSGINNTEYNRVIKVFPNPARSQVNISMHSNGKTKIVIHDVFGREVYANKLQNTGTNVVETIDISDWAKGMYIVKVSTSVGINTTKLVVE